MHHQEDQLATAMRSLPLSFNAAVAGAVWSVCDEKEKPVPVWDGHRFLT
jgi:hypothetical protein